jgi:hypothetical protein
MLNDADEQVDQGGLGGFSASILRMRRLRCGRDTRNYSRIYGRFRTPPFADRHDTTTKKDISAKLV